MRKSMLAVFIIYMLCSFANARVITVAPSGGDYPTIAAGVSAANAGDTVKVKPATYGERISISKSGAAGSPIVVKADPRRQAITNGFDITGSYIRVEGFEVVPFGTSYGITANGTHNQIVDNYMHDMYKAIDVSGQDHYVGYNRAYMCQSAIGIGGKRILVEYNEVERIVSYNDMFDADYSRFFGDSLTFRHNWFHGTIWDAANGKFTETGTAHVDCYQTFDLGDSSTITKHVLWEYNIFADCHQGVMAEGTKYQQSGYFTFRNNLFLNCRSAGMIGTQISNVTVINNTFVTSTAWGVAGSITQSCVIKNNIFCNFSDKVISLGNWSIAQIDYNLYFNCILMFTTGAHDLVNADPMFMNADSNNFQLQPGSPAIRAGVDLGVIDDLYGRPRGIPPDLGAFESDKVPPLAPTGLTTTSITEHIISLQWTASAPAADGDNASYYKIFRDGVFIDTTSQTSFTDQSLAESKTYNYTVYALDKVNNQSLSAATGSFTTITDHNGPVVLTVISQSLTKTQVVFDEKVDRTTGETASNYQITGGVTITSAVLQADQQSVVLTTSQQTEGNQYTITISNVKDIAAAPNTMTQAQKQFTALFKFEDDFESGNISQWTPSSSSNWSVVDDAGDKSLLISTLTPEKLLVNRTYTVMSFDADIKGFGSSTYRNVSVVFGYKDANNYYHMNFSGNNGAVYNGIFKVVNGTETKQASPIAGLLTDVTQYHHIRVTWDSATGDIRAYFDQSATPVCTAVDQTHTSGQVGVWSKTKQAYIDNVEVVARVRTDSFGLTAVRGQILAGNKDVAPHRYTGPNPVNSITEIRQLEQLQGAIIYDLSGRRVDIKETRHNGIYLLRAAGTTLLQKIVLMKQ